jgi:hypothetical protein
MKRTSPVAILVITVVLLMSGVAWLFQMRFSHGDVYPAYSTLRADPLGAMALFESFDALPGVTARRDVSASGRLPETRAAYLHLAGDPFDWMQSPRDTVDEVERFLRQGGRLILAFSPDWRGVSGLTPTVKTWTVPPAVVTGNTNVPTTVTMTNNPPNLRRTWKQIQRENDHREHVDVEARWGFSIHSRQLSVGVNHLSEAVTVTNVSGLALPARLPWHSANQLSLTGTNWSVIYARGTNAVIAERRLGAGTLVLATDCYFASNESLARDPQSALLAWLVSGQNNVVFDEAHLGVMESPGVTTLMWRFGLQGMVAGVLVLLALFIWKNAISFVPYPRATTRAANEVAGRDSTAGFVNLLRRYIKPSEILAVCFDEWTRSLRHRASYTFTGVDQAQTRMEAEMSRPVHLRNPLQAYNDIARALKRSPGVAPADISPTDNSTNSTQA